MRKPLYAGNWKMHMGAEAAAKFGHQLTEALNGGGTSRKIADGAAEVVVFPPFVSISSFEESVLDSPVKYGAQNCYHEPKGAFTGEVSVAMLEELGCDYILIGHSERRHVFNESDELIAKKVAAVLTGNATCVLCVGELISEREGGKTYEVLERQFLSALAGVDPDTVAKKVVLAYEPVWAIGTGKTASDNDAQDGCQFLRRCTAERFGDEAAENVRIIYGGSVKPANTASLMSCPDIDGLLIGGASLEAPSFMGIIEAGLSV